MPELPEIETLKNQLAPSIINRHIVGSFNSGKKLRRIMPDLLQLNNQKILSIYRRNKYLVLELTSNWLIIHLGMTGQLTIDQTKNIKKHTHFILFLSGGLYLSYEDARRFGSLDIFSSENFPDYHDIPMLKKLGIEPLENNFTFEMFSNGLEYCKLEIKKYLMDSNRICGIGNIYANEILFLSKINPFTKIPDLTVQQKKSLFANITLVLYKAISLGGSSISDFVHINGQRGTMQDNYFVYGRTNQPCKVCSHGIERHNQSGRSSFFCPICQPLLSI